MRGTSSGRSQSPASAADWGFRVAGLHAERAESTCGQSQRPSGPANCGPTSLGLKKLDVWLGDGKWDVIHFNFGIHDRNTPVAEYSQRLEQLVERMKKTGAKLVWASTTPIPDDPAKKQTAASIVERNKAAAADHGETWCRDRRSLHCDHAAPGRNAEPTRRPFQRRWVTSSSASRWLKPSTRC